MNVATPRVEVGVRDLKNNLSRYLDRVQAGEDIVVTDRGRPIARLSQLDHGESRLARLIAEGAVIPPKAPSVRHLPNRLRGTGPVSDLVTEQRA